MKTRPFGNTGIEVSEIGLGGWQLGEAGWNGPDGSEAVRLVHQALASGVTFFDTAPGYGRGRSEALLGEALLGRRAEVVLCTKFGHGVEGTNFDHRGLVASVEGSLRRLRTDYLDMVLLHNPPIDHLDAGRSPHLEILEGLRGRGLVRAYGASVDWPDEIDLVLTTSHSHALEVWLSAFHQETWQAVERAQKAGVGTIIKVPLESGWLCGRYGAQARFSDVRKRWPPADIERRAALVDRLRGLLPAGVSLTQAALRFVLAHPGVSTVIPGARSLGQLQDNLSAGLAPLPARTVADIRGLFEAEISGRPLAW